MNPSRRLPYPLRVSFGRFSRNLIGSIRRRTARTRHIRVIMNPAAGPDRNVLKMLNSIFQQAGVDWDVDVTHRSGDGRRLAQRALASGAQVIAAYGGDGTITDVASGMLGSPVPLGILPGGTTNSIAASLGIPTDVGQAARLLVETEPVQRELRLGQVNGHFFTQMVGIGLEARMIEATDRAQKDRLGILAYGINALNALAHPPLARYILNLDGNIVDAEGVTVFVLNVDNLNIPSLQEISPWPRRGLLDVFLVARADLLSLLSLAASAAGVGIPVSGLSHWQARRVSIAADPPQPAQGDGEFLGTSPVFLDSLPGEVHVIIPDRKGTPVPEVIVTPGMNLPGSTGFIGRDHANSAGS